jgi:hypothetical protein
MKIKDLIENASTVSTSSGDVAVITGTLGAVLRRNTPATTKPKRKYANTIKTSNYTLKK